MTVSSCSSNTTLMILMIIYRYMLFIKLILVLRGFFLHNNEAELKKLKIVQGKV